MRSVAGAYVAFNKCGFGSWVTRMDGRQDTRRWQRNRAVRAVLCPPVDNKRAMARDHVPSLPLGYHLLGSSRCRTLTLMNRSPIWTSETNGEVLNSKLTPFSLFFFFSVWMVLANVRRNQLIDLLITGSGSAILARTQVSATSLSILFREVVPGIWSRGPSVLALGSGFLFRRHRQPGRPATTCIRR